MAWNAADMVYYLCKAGDLIKGKGKGDMKSGATVIGTTLFAAGAAASAGVSKLAKKRKNNKKK